MGLFGTSGDSLGQSLGSTVLLSMKERFFFFDRLVLEKLFDGKLWFDKNFPKL